jgi:preprotein translocase subunit SecG
MFKIQNYLIICFFIQYLVLLSHAERSTRGGISDMIIENFMKWSVHPAKQNRTKTVLSLVFVFCFIVFVLLFYGVVLAVLGCAILFVSLHSYYFPTYYETTQDEIIIKNIFVTQRRKIREFKRLYEGKNGILLSPFRHKTFLNQFRGVFLLLPPEREDIINYLNAIINIDSEVSQEVRREKTADENAESQ